MSENPVELPKTVSFEHAFFRTFENTHFRLSDPPEERPVLVGDMGDQDVTLTLTGVAREFHIDKNSADGIMLDVVARSLEFVSAIKPGDAVPVEVLTGDASWDPEAVHEERARRRINLAIVTWHEGGAPAILDVKEIDAAYEAANAESKRDGAIAALNEKIEIEGDPTELVDGLIAEFAFIESMRDKHLAICRVKAVVTAIRKMHAKEMSVSGEFEPVMRLLPIPVKTLHEILGDVDARLTDLEALFADFDGACAFIRSSRNDLYRRMSAWDEPIEFWGGIDPRQPETFNLVERVRDLYRFLAARYMPVDEWVLMFSEEDDAPDLKYGGVMTW
ncbi:MAG: hypothetical protein ABJ215_02855 [Alphaproteobacteria bacterium]